MDDLTYDQAKSIISDKTNPHYARYHNNDADVHGAVTAAFLRKFPGEYDTSNTTPEALRGGAAPEAGNPQAGADRLEVAGPEAAAQLAGYLGVAPGGPEFDAFKRDANEYINATFESYDEFFELAKVTEGQVGAEKAVKMLRDAMKGRGK